MPCSPSKARDLAQTLRAIAAGYHGILDLLGATKSSRIAPEVRISAILQASNTVMARVLEDGAREAENRVDFGKATVRAPEGHQYSPEIVHGAVLDALSSSIGMEAHSNNWLDAEGTIILPALPAASLEDEAAVQVMQYLAICWTGWELAERRHRYLGGRLQRRDAVEPDLLARGVKYVWESDFDQEAIEIYDQIANQRLVERLKQQYLQLASNPLFRHAARGLSGPVALLPMQAVSLAEMHALLSLKQILSVTEEDEPVEFAGLTLAEWVRGHAVLKRCAEEAMRAGPGRMNVRFAKGELARLLVMVGLDEEKAAVFIKHACFQGRSRDLFDQPLLALQDGSLVLPAITASITEISQVVLSTFGMLGVDLKDRGKRFQRDMIDFLCRQGFDAKTLTWERDGETYDYDVLFVWDHYLFHFECKSRGLSGGSPVGTHNFRDDIKSSLSQVQRLREGLARYPDMLEIDLPAGVGKKVVHCVLNSLPYALPDGIDGILFADQGAVTRFFDHSAVTEVVLGSQNLEPDLADRRPVIAELWNGPTPSPEDFLRQLTRPIQFVIAQAHSTSETALVPIGADSVCIYPVVRRTDSSPDSMREAARAAGFPTGPISSGQG